jgi:hypothetical protein
MVILENQKHFPILMQALIQALTAVQSQERLDELMQTWRHNSLVNRKARDGD